MAMVRMTSTARIQWDEQEQVPDQQTAKSKKDDGKKEFTGSSSVGPGQQTAKSEQMTDT
jgi:hypothetical protein